MPVLKKPPPRSIGTAWLPALSIPFIAGLSYSRLPAWEFMWLLALLIYFSLKWAQFREAALRGTVKSRTILLGFLLLWPGMDASPFAQRRAAPQPVWEWMAACFKTALGVISIWLVAPLLPSYWAGWAAMLGLILILHFGLFHILALTWRAAGFAVEPLMNRPLLASSLSDFWTRRWNQAFSTLAHHRILQPLRRQAGLPAATFAVFFISGIIHDVVISLPARGGYGLPTLYFLLQWLGLSLQRSLPARKSGLHRGIAGWFLTLFTVLAPAGLLFHAPFMQNVMVPFLRALHAL